MNPRAAELFDRAIDLPEDDRDAWLDQVCDGDDALRCEVERLLRADAKARTFMETPPALVSRAAEAALREEPPVFGAYRVVRSLGRGGMGEVWLAERQDGEFEQRVAIKQLAYPTPGLLQRFRQERQILAHLDHPHIAHLIDGGLAADSTPYLAMEYVEGMPITEYVRNAGLDTHARLRLFLRVCDAVQYAHQNLVVHRDLKPSNIFVTADGMPKLLDFGIAKVLSATDPGAQTQTVARMLTPEYAAPEQFDGGVITTATDVYALGVVLYELLTDARPYRTSGENAQAIAKILTGDPTPPSAAIARSNSDAGHRRRLLRGDLDGIVLKAMAREARHRYASAEALAADIRRYLDGRAVSARGGSAAYRLLKFARRNRYALAATLLVLLVCVAATVISLRQAQRANAQAQRALAARQFLVDVFEQASPDASRGRPMTAHELLERGEQRLALGSTEPAAVRADVVGMLGSLYWSLGDYDRALPLLLQTEQLASAVGVPDDVNARNLATLASIEIGNRNHDVAMRHAQKALEYALRAGPIAAREQSDARRTIAMAKVSSTSTAEAAKDLHTLLDEDTLKFGADSDIVARDLNALGIAQFNAANADEAIAALQRALTINHTLHGDSSAAASENLFYIGMALWKSDRVVAAEEAMQKTVDMRTRIYGADHPETLSARTYLLLMQEEQGRYAESLPKRLALREDQRRRFGNTNPKALANADSMLGLTYIVLGRLGEAEQTLRESLALWNTAQGPNSALALRPLSNLAYTLQSQGRYTEAEAMQRDAVRISSGYTSQDSETTNSERGYLGTTLRLQRRYPEALAELRGAVASMDAHGHGQGSVAMRLQAQLAEAELDAGNVDAAYDAASRAVAIGRKTLPAGSIRLASSLSALGRATLAKDRPLEAEQLFEEALAARSPPAPRSDLHVIEVQIARIQALSALGKTAESRALRAEILPLLKASPYPRAKELLERVEPD